MTRRAAYTAVSEKKCGRIVFRFGLRCKSSGPSEIARHFCCVFARRIGVCPQILVTKLSFLVIQPFPKKSAAASFFGLRQFWRFPAKHHLSGQGWLRNLNLAMRNTDNCHHVKGINTSGAVWKALALLSEGLVFVVGPLIWMIHLTEKGQFALLSLVALVWVTIIFLMVRAARSGAPRLQQRLPHPRKLSLRWSAQLFVALFLVGFLAFTMVVIWAVVEGDGVLALTYAACAIGALYLTWLFGKTL